MESRGKGERGDNSRGRKREWSEKFMIAKTSSKQTTCTKISGPPREKRNYHSRKKKGRVWRRKERKKRKNTRLMIGSRNSQQKQ